MSRTPRLVELSVSLYRLLLAAYPVAFRNEYGAAMTQLFRDTALDGYQRRGARGLLAVWLRTLMDFAVSVARQHREETVRAGESLSLHYLAQQWLALGSVLLSVTILSIGYAFHVVLRRPWRTWAVVSAITFALVCWSFFGHVGIITLWEGTDLDIKAGNMEFRHIYDHAELISEKLWYSSDNPFRSKSPLSGPMPWEFSFSLGHVRGYGGGLGFIRPCFYWRLRIPLLFIPVLLLCWPLLARPRGNSLSGPAMQSA